MGEVTLLAAAGVGHYFWDRLCSPFPVGHQLLRPSTLTPWFSHIPLMHPTLSPPWVPPWLLLGCALYLIPGRGFHFASWWTCASRTLGSCRQGTRVHPCLPHIVRDSQEAPGAALCWMIRMNENWVWLTWTKPGKASGKLEALWSCLQRTPSKSCPSCFHVCSLGLSGSVPFALQLHICFFLIEV